MGMSCRKQRFLKRLIPSVVALWLFVCAWCPLVHYKSHTAFVVFPFSLLIQECDFSCVFF